MASSIPPMPKDVTVPEPQDGDPSAKPASRLVGRLWALVLAYPNLFLGMLLSVAVCAPWLNGGRLLLLDWSTAQPTQLFPSQLLGLHGGLIASYPFGFFVNVILRLVGVYGSLLPIIVFFPIASVAIGRLIPGKRIGKLAGALLYCVNPFVYDRIFVGHLGLLLGYALLPFAFLSLLSIGPSGRRFSGLKVGVWWTVLIGCSPHFLWIFGIPLGFYLVLNLASWKITKNLLGAVFFVFLTNIYIYTASRVGGIGQRIGINNLIAYRTLPDPHLGLIANVVGLYGFWRLGPALAKNLITGWPLVLFAILVVAGSGFYGAVRGRPLIPGRTWTRRNSMFILLCGILGIFLAMGDQGPTGSVFRFAYIHVPFFAVMREPQKFLMLWAMVLAIGFGMGVEKLKLANSDGKLQKLVFIVVLALPLIYQPLMFWGLSGQVQTSHYPKSWYTVRSMISGRQGALLALPWHEYLAFPFTGHRVIANPASQFFGGKVIVGGNVELPNIFSTSTSQRQAYLDYILPEGGTVTNFGALLRPLGVQYVALFKTVDWKNYGWLARQNDMSLVYSSNSVELYRNVDYKGIAYMSSGIRPVNSLGSVITLAQQDKLTNQTISLGESGLGSFKKNASKNEPRHGTKGSASIRQTSSSGFEITTSSSGWVDVALSYDSGWKINNITPVETAFGTMAWYLPAGRADAVFAPANVALMGDYFSLLMFLIGIGAICFVRGPETRDPELD